MKVLTGIVAAAFILAVAPSDAFANSMKRGASSTPMRTGGQAVAPRVHQRGGTQTIYTQMHADRVKHQRDRWRIRQEQVRIYEQQQAITINRARNADRAFEAFQV